MTDLSPSQGRGYSARESTKGEEWAAALWSTPDLQGNSVQGLLAECGSGTCTWVSFIIVFLFNYSRN